MCGSICPFIFFSMKRDFKGVWIPAALWLDPDTNITEITDKRLGTVITFDPVAAKAGLCNWPFNFDPERIECYVPLEKLEIIEI